MGFCAAHAAAAAMLTAGENRIVKPAAVGERGEPIPPCCRCRAFIAQLRENSRLCQTLLPRGRTIGELPPFPWN